MSEAKNAEAELAELIAREMCKYRGEDPDDSAPEEYIRDSERPTSMWQMFSSETGLIARALLAAGYAKREDVLEEAAKVADAELVRNNEDSKTEKAAGDTQRMYLANAALHASSRIATAIRSLKGQP